MAWCERGAAYASCQRQYRCKCMCVCVRRVQKNNFRYFAAACIFRSSDYSRLFNDWIVTFHLLSSSKASSLFHTTVANVIDWTRLRTYARPPVIVDAKKCISWFITFPIEWRQSKWNEWKRYKRIFKFNCLLTVILIFIVFFHHTGVCLCARFIFIIRFFSTSNWKQINISRTGTRCSICNILIEINT